MGQTIIQLGLLIVSGIAIFSVVVPMFNDIGSVQAETKEYDEAISNAFETNQRLESLINRLNQYTQQERYRLELFIQETLDPTRIAYDLEVLVGDSGMFLTDIMLGQETRIPSPVNRFGSAQQIDTVGFDVPTKPSDELAVLDVDMSVSGTYEQYKELLRLVESSAQLMEVQNMSFGGSDSDIYQFALTIRLFGINPSNI